MKTCRWRYSFMDGTQRMVEMAVRQPPKENKSGCRCHPMNWNRACQSPFRPCRRCCCAWGLLTDDRAMAAAATTGDSNMPVKGYSKPAAIWTPAKLSANKRKSQGQRTRQTQE
jgi:hypothetical protein